ncbi:MAG: hypothetical protein JRG96_18330 [Deltaproteobacteria bacterium]|nr:hypothetical protein [Deltaproteobacteria bacterium]MBW2420392.1 hypothetical protein [Deltaproteobacteria bacterium]
MSGEDRRLSWKEVDQRRDGTRERDERRPKGKAAEERAAQATKEYIKAIDKLFSVDEGGSEGAALAKAVRDAHGTPELADACRAMRDTCGIPRDVELLSIFLDSNDQEIVVAGLEALLELQNAGELEVGKGLTSQLRVLAQDFNNDIADVAEEIVEKL